MTLPAVSRQQTPTPEGNRLSSCHFRKLFSAISSESAQCRWLPRSCYPLAAMIEFYSDAKSLLANTASQVFSHYELYTTSLESTYFQYDGAGLEHQLLKTVHIEFGLNFWSAIVCTPGFTKLPPAMRAGNVLFLPCVSVRWLARVWA